MVDLDVGRTGLHGDSKKMCKAESLKQASFLSTLRD